MFIKIILLLGVVLNGCVFTGKQEKNADLLVEQYHQIEDLTYATIDEKNDLTLCVRLKKYRSDDNDFVTVQIPWRRFETRSFSRLLLPKGQDRYLLQNSQVTNGCTLIKTGKQIEVEVRTIDNEVLDYPDLYKYLQRLETGKDGYSLYLIHSNKLKIIEIPCKGFFNKNKKCKLDESHFWPRIVIKVKTHHRHYPVSIIAGHSGEKQGHRAMPLAGAIALDIVTFPFQAVLLAIVIAVGAK